MYIMDDKAVHILKLNVCIMKITNERNNKREKRTTKIAETNLSV